MIEQVEHNSVKKSSKFVFIIWLLPFIALLISSWMLYKHFDDQGEKISVYFNNAEGFVAGKTPLKYKGIKIGIISSIEVDEKNINRFLVKIEVHKKALPLVATKGAKFWKVEPKATITEISGLDTILSGVYIEAMPMVQNIEEIKKLKSQYTFEAVSEKPINYFDDGVFLTLKSEKGTLEVGSSVLYKSFIVGKIVKKNLIKNDIFYTIFIENDYKDLIKEDSNFWNISGVELKASLSGIKFKIDTLASLVAGGIEFDSDDFSPTLKDKTKVFNLYDNKEEIEYLKDYVILETKKEHGLQKEFSKVYYNGIEVAYVDDMSYMLNDNKGYLFIKFKKQFASLLEHNPYFQLISPEISLEKLENISSLIKGNHIKVFKTSNKKQNKKEIYNLHSLPMAKEVYTIVLKSDEGIKVSKNAPVYFKDIKVGRVKSKKLHKNSDELRLEVEIFKKYQYLVNQTTNFYMQSPVEFKASLENISFKTAPLSGFINSSIAFETSDVKAKKLSNRFYLFESYDKMLKDKYLQQKGERFTINIDDASKISQKSSVYYKGVEAGKIIDKKYNEKSNSVDVEVFIFDKFAKHINESTKFYSIGGIDVDFSLKKIDIKTTSLNTLIKGGVSFVTLNEKAKSVNRYFNFSFYDSLKDIYKEQNFNNDGLRVIVKAKRKSSLKVNSPVYYRQVKIGLVEKFELSNDGTHVKLQLYINKKFKHLVRENSIFYNATAFGMDISLFGVKVTTETLETLISGGISLVTPTKYEKKAQNLQEFILYDDVKNEWLEWNPKFEKL